MNLANTLVSTGHKVVLWSSAYYHQEKRHRCRLAARVTVSPNLEIRLIPSPGYRRHIGLARLWDHALLAHNLSRWLDEESELPDVCFIGYPPIETAAVMTRWMAERGVPTLLDVQDQWPSIFLDVLPGPLGTIGRIGLSPYFYLARRAMRDASALLAMSSSFLRWAVNFADRTLCDLDMVVPLTNQFGKVSEIELALAKQWWESRGICLDGKLRVCFVGSHSTAFDFSAIVEAAETLSNKDFTCEFIICGHGPSSREWRQQAKNLSNVNFVGWVELPQIEVIASLSLAALAPYKNTKNFVSNLPNKVIDSLALGLPILSPLEGEVANLIDQHEVGLGYGERTGRTLAECIELLALNPCLRSSLSENARAVYRENFDFDIVYKTLILHMEDLALKNSQSARASICP